MDTTTVSQNANNSFHAHLWRGLSRGRSGSSSTVSYVFSQLEIALADSAEILTTFQRLSYAQYACKMPSTRRGHATQFCTVIIKIMRNLPMKISWELLLSMFQGLMPRSSSILQVDVRPTHVVMLLSSLTESEYQTYLFCLDLMILNRHWFITKLLVA